MTLADVFSDRARQAPDAPALTFDRAPYQGVVLTWRELERRASELYRRLASFGPGRRFGVVLTDHPDLLPTLVAAWRADGVVVPVDPQWGPALTASVLAHSQAQVRLEVATGTAAPVADAPRRPEPSLPPGTAFVSYTSGSTSDPKGVVLTHVNLRHAYTAAADGVAASLGGMPGIHGCAMRMSGLGVLGMSYLWAATAAARMVVLPELSLATAGGYWHSLDRHRIELTYLVPPLVELLVRVGRPDEAAPRRPIFISGGAPLSPATQERFQRSRRSTLLNAYGLTEASFAVFFGDLDERTGRATPSIGYPVTARARIRRDDGSVCDGAADGELELAGPAVSAGYYGNPDATHGTFQDGWLRTGDLVHRDDGGRYHVTGRLKDVVLKGAFSIHLNEVEDVAADLPHVIEAVAVPLRLATGEDVGVILRAASEALDVDAARAELARRLGPQRAPRHLVVTTVPLPRVGQGKIARSQALAMWRALVSSRPANPYRAT